MSEFKDKIGAAAGKVEYLYDPATGRFATQITCSSPGKFAMYIVAVSLDGRHLLAEVPATGIGVRPVQPEPSILTYIQSDEQGMWGRNCPLCQKYFRTTHVMAETSCPYCAAWASGLAFISKEQRKYIIACYDAFARAYMGKKSTSVEAAEITDANPAWHYSEVKQQFHFTCDAEKCGAETDILGEYGFCPRCGLTNGRKLFAERMDKMLGRIEGTQKAFPDGSPAHRKARAEVWEELVKTSVSDFEALARHLRAKLLLFPMTSRRRKQLKEVNFQAPETANQDLKSWFDIGLFEWAGDKLRPPKSILASDLPFINKLIQKRHVLMHNGGVVDQDYLDRSGDTQVTSGERISVSSKEAKRFIECIRAVGTIFMDNVEFGFKEALIP